MAWSTAPQAAILLTGRTAAGPHALACSPTGQHSQMIHSPDSMVARGPGVVPIAAPGTAGPRSRPRSPRVRGGIQHRPEPVCSANGIIGNQDRFEVTGADSVALTLRTGQAIRSHRRSTCGAVALVPRWKSRNSPHVGRGGGCVVTATGCGNNTSTRAGKVTPIRVGPGRARFAPRQRAHRRA